MRWLFTLLFTYPAPLWSQGTLAFAASRRIALVVLGLSAVAALAVLTYRRTGTHEHARASWGLMAIRLGLISVLAWCLLQPTLVVTSSAPQQNVVAVLLDDSGSMQQPDADGTPRRQFITTQFTADAPLLRALAQKFVVRLYRVGASAQRMSDAAGLTFDAPATHLGAALAHVREDLAGLPVAGIVLVSDGADTTATPSDDSVRSLAAAQLPLFAVGVGAERVTRDLEVRRVEAPRDLLRGSAATVTAVIAHAGLANRPVTVRLEDDGRIVATETVTLPDRGDAVTVPLRYTADDVGARHLTVRALPVDGEPLTANNARGADVEVRDGRDRVLYLEGEPRFEMKFIRRAVGDDPHLAVSIVQRTAEQKYLRLDIGSPDEAAGGFPATRAELFGYRAVVLGSVEAASFTPDQLRMLAAFVSERGGSLLMLGGRRAFAEGGWAGTPVAQVLPVRLTGTAHDPASGELPVIRLTVRPTDTGRAALVTQLADTLSASDTRWRGLPALTTVNVLGPAKPGAEVWLSGRATRGADLTVLAWQRFGRGKAAAFAVQDSWVWQMDASIPVDDPTHGRFWRRLVRWLTDGVPEPTTVRVLDTGAAVGASVPLQAEIRDDAFGPVNDAQVVATVTGSDGVGTDVPFRWTAARDGDYAGAFMPSTPGVYTVTVTATHQDGHVGTATTHVRVGLDDEEPYEATLHRTQLERWAAVTGGRYVAARDVGQLPDLIQYAGHGITVTDTHDIWDLPIVLLVLLALLCGEWVWRRREGLA